MLQKSRVEPDLAERLPALRRKLYVLQESIQELLEVEQRDAALETEGGGQDIAASEHPADVAADLEMRELAVSESLAHRRQLREIENALERMDQGAYGTCVECGGPIPTERLEVRPQAIRDVRCEVRAERAAA